MNDKTNPNDDPLVQQVEEHLRKDREDLFYEMLRLKAGVSESAPLKYILPIILFVATLVWIMCHPQYIGGFVEWMHTKN